MHTYKLNHNYYEEQKRAIVVWHDVRRKLSESLEKELPLQDRKSCSGILCYISN